VGAPRPVAAPQPAAATRPKAEPTRVGLPGRLRHPAGRLGLGAPGASLAEVVASVVLLAMRLAQLAPPLAQGERALRAVRPGRA